MLNIRICLCKWQRIWKVAPLHLTLESKLKKYARKFPVLYYLCKSGPRANEKLSTSSSNSQLKHFVRLNLNNLFGFFWKRHPSSENFCHLISYQLSATLGKCKNQQMFYSWSCSHRHQSIMRSSWSFIINVTATNWPHLLPVGFQSVLCVWEVVLVINHTCSEHFPRSLTASVCQLHCFIL